MAVETVRVACNHCGASLDVDDETRFVTCTHCDTTLAVRREEGALFTEVKKAVTKLQKRAEKIESDVDVLKLEAELARVERDWEERRPSLMSRSKDGRLTAPTRVGAALVVGAMCTLGAVAAWSDAGPIIGALIAAAGLVFGVVQHSRALAYEHALQAHLEQRSAIMARLRKARREEPSDD